MHHGADRLNRGGERWELADRGADALRDAMQAEPNFGDNAKRAFRPNEKPRQIIAIGGLARAPAGLDDTPIRQHHFKPQNIFANGAIAHRIGAGSARGAHAANGAMAAGINREEQPLGAQKIIQGLARDTGFNQAIHILSV